MRNCTILNNGTTQAAGTSIFGSVHPPRMIIENCDFQDVNAFVLYRNFPDITNYDLNRFEPIVFRNCKFAYSIIEGNQVTMTHPNVLFENCQINSNIINQFSVCNVKPQQRVYKTVLSGSTININANYNHYFISGVIDKILPTSGIDGTFIFTATDTVTFTSYVNPGNTGSNMNFNATILPGESITMYYNGTQVKSASTVVVTNDFIETAGGSATCFDNWGALTSSPTNPIEEYSMVVTAGAITLTDSGNGILTGSGGRGWVDYFRNSIVLCFDIAPTVGTTIEADYRYHSTIHQTGMWSKID